MCGRYTLTSDLSLLEERFEFHAPHLRHSPRYNIAPTQDVLAITGDVERRADLFRWGLIPSWAREPSLGNRMINARAETVAERAAYRVALRKRRCLVLADGFYEWKREGNRRVPMRIVLASRELFAFAGLWDAWKGPSGERVLSCTIITTTSNAIMEPIHSRMPVILSKDAESVWLDQTVEDPGAVTALLSSHPAEDMEAYEVSTLVNSPKHDHPELIAPEVKHWQRLGL